MANISTYLANHLLDHSVGKTSFTMPTVFVAAFTTTPTMPAGTGGVEVTTSGTAYARQTTSGATWVAAASGSNSNAASVSFAQATAAYGTVVGVGLFDAVSGGNLLAAGNLTASQVVNTGDTFSFPIGDLTLTFS